MAEAFGGADHGGQAAFHVRRPPAPKPLPVKVTFERRWVQASGPGGTTSVWPARPESGRPPPDRPEIGDIPFVHALAVKAQGFEAFGDQGEAARVLRSYGGAADQRLGEGEGRFHDLGALMKHGV